MIEKLVEMLGSPAKLVFILSVIVSVIVCTIQYYEYPNGCLPYFSWCVP